MASEFGPRPVPTETEPEVKKALFAGAETKIDDERLIAKVSKQRFLMEPRIVRKIVNIMGGDQELARQFIKKKYPRRLADPEIGKILGIENEEE